MSKPEKDATGSDDEAEKELLQSSPEAKPTSPERISLSELYWESGSRIKCLLVTGTISGCSMGVVMSLFYAVMGQLYDDGTDEDEDDYDMYQETVKVTYIFIIIGVLVMISAYVASFCFVRLGQSIGSQFRKRYYRSILGKTIPFFDHHPVTELPAQMGQDCRNIEDGSGEKMLFFIEVSSYVTAGCLVAILKSPQLFLVALSVMSMNVVGGGLVGYSVQDGIAIKHKAYMKAGAIAEESLMEVKTLSSFNGQEYMAGRYNAELEENTKLISKLGAINGLGWGINWVAWMFSGAVLFWTAAKWIGDEHRNWIWGDDMEGPDVVTIFWTVAFVCNWFGHSIPAMIALLEALASAARAKKFISAPSEFENGTEEKPVMGKVEFRDVHFSYPKRPEVEVLTGISFTCEQKQKTAIVGESGSGKSTIIQLIERFYEPNSGVIVIDDMPVRQFNIDFLRRAIGYVSQEPVLFNLTIEENIMLGKPGATTEDVEEAAKIANAFNFIVSLQDGFHTLVGVKGSRLSGGQKQRIAIARAMIRKPALLLLDEATSALDNESEEIVLRVLESIHANTQTTMISVAQKLSTIRSSDKILVLQAGKVAEEGTHTELRALGGLYSQMCTAQMIDVDETYAQLKPQTTGPIVEAVASKERTPTDLREEEKSSLPFIRIMKTLTPYWPLMLIGSFSSIAAGSYFPVFGYLIGKMSYYIIGRTGDEFEDTMRTLALWTMALGVICLITFVIFGFSFYSLTARLTKQLREQCFLKILHLEASFFDDPTNNAAMLSQNLDSDAEKLNTAGGPLLGSFFIFFSSWIFGAIISTIWQWKLGLLMAGMIPVQGITLTRGFLVRMEGVSHPKHQNASSYANDSIMNVKTVTAYQMQAPMVTRFESLLDKAYNETKNETHLNGFIYGFGLCIIYWGFAVCFWFGGWLRLKDQAGDEDIYVSIFSNFMTVVGISVACLMAPGVAEGSEAAKRIFRVMDYRGTIDSHSPDGLTTEIQGNVTFSNVSFRYVGRENLVLQNISFDVPAGTTLGITGASGSGKTTLTQLLLRFYDPIEGKVTIDGVSVSEFNISHLRRQIAMVSQEPVMFHGTVKHNVDFGLGKSDEEIKEALKHASIPRFADELDRDVGVRGSMISGGQKQRVAIARAILRNPKILLLDEATSALDTRTERKILAALEFAGRDKTVIVIAHRLSTIEKCDQIVVMDGGKIQEKGTHEELKNKEDGIYRKLLAFSSSQAS